MVHQLGEERRGEQRRGEREREREREVQRKREIMNGGILRYAQMSLALVETLVHNFWGKKLIG